MDLCIPRGEFCLADPTKPSNDEDLAATFLGRFGLELLLDLVELRITSYELFERDASQAERDFVSIYQLESVSGIS